MTIFNILLIWLILINLNSAAQHSLYSQGGYNPSERKVVKIDPNSHVAVGDIPFDCFFYVRLYAKSKAFLPKYIFLFKSGDVPDSTDQLATLDVNNHENTKDDVYIDAGYQVVEVLLPPLDPNSHYELKVIDGLYDIYADIMIKLANGHKGNNTLYNNTPLINSNIRPSADKLQGYYVLHKDKIDSLIDDKGSLAKYLESNPTFNDNHGANVDLFKGPSDSYIINSFQSKIEVSSLFNLVADIGVAVCGFQEGFNSLTPYFGVNYSFRSFDSDIPWHYLRKRVKWYQRFSLNCGLTTSSLAKEGYRSDFFGSKNLLFGVGYKFSHVVSLNTGGVFFHRLGNNPLIDKKAVGVVPFIALSVNLKIRAALGELANLFSK